MKTSHSASKEHFSMFFFPDSNILSLLNNAQTFLYRNTGAFSCRSVPPGFLLWHGDSAPEPLKEEKAKSPFSLPPLRIGTPRIKQNLVAVEIQLRNGKPVTLSDELLGTDQGKAYAESLPQRLPLPFEADMSVGFFLGFMENEQQNSSALKVLPEIDKMLEKQRNFQTGTVDLFRSTVTLKDSLVPPEDRNFVIENERIWSAPVRRRDL